MKNNKLPAGGAATPPNNWQKQTGKQRSPYFIPPRLNDKEAVHGAVHTVVAGFPNSNPKMMRYWSKWLLAAGWRLVAYVWPDGTKGVFSLPVGVDPSPLLLVDKYRLFRERLEQELLGSQKGVCS